MALYPEVTHTRASNGTWVLQAPWMRSMIDGFVPGLEPATAEDLYSFGNVKRLPFWFHPPRSSRDRAHDQGARPFDEQALVEFLVDCRATLNRDFSWLLDDVLLRSNCRDANDTFDPLSLFGAMQRLILLDSMILNDLGEKVRDALKSWGTSQRKSLFLDLVHVSHYVTRNAPGMLLEALNFTGAAETCLREFLAEEQDHDVFARKSLLLLTGDQSSCGLFEPPKELSLLMELLRMCAHASPLALAACLFIFEGLAYDTPVWTPWDVLAHMDHRHRQQGVGRHTMINERARHGDIGYTLAQALPGQSAAEASLAVRLTELCVELRLQLVLGIYSSVGFKILQIVPDGGIDTTPGSNPGPQLPLGGKAQLS
ncbi:MAG TPA: hypothetical protein VE871_17095 [Longimicrobium sp.]|nr:hypothetical protein [Longimicrobium sp.]